MVMPQVFSMIGLIFVVNVALRPEDVSHSVIFGCAIYLIYSLCSRQIIASAHRTGIRLSKRGRFQEAIALFEQSYQFFTKHKWIDRFRSLVLMSPSAISYREMALVNIAFCHSQIGNAESAKEYYEKTLQEFPDSGMAKASLNMIKTFEKTQNDPPPIL
jgi:tetratricopeptide (TPR) repeat protein